MFTPLDHMPRPRIVFAGSAVYWRVAGKICGPYLGEIDQLIQI